MCWTAMPAGRAPGTGAAVAANLAAVGVGTETDGSIVCPSTVNGLVGIKPTVGLVSRAGIIPISHTQDTAGPMARTVADAARAARRAGRRRSARRRDDRARPRTRGRTTRRRLDPDALGARIGVARKRYFGYSAAADRLVEPAIADMKRARRGHRRSGGHPDASNDWTAARWRCCSTSSRPG